MTRWRAIAVALTVAAALAIASTYRVFSQTYDEPAHVAAGMEWLSRGAYRYEPQHPPLARIAAALGPYARGARSLGKINEFYEGDLLLDREGEYRTRLALARLGELPFFLMLCLGVWLWGRRLYGEGTAVLALLFVATNPTVLAHAGFATTDIAVTAAMTLALYTYMRWRDEPTRRHALLFGLSMAFVAASKFSGIPYMGLALVLAEGWHAYLARRTSVRWQLPVRQLLAATGAGAVALWAVYRFHVGRISPTGPILPAPELIRGLSDFLFHGNVGHSAFLLGQHSETGWWYYFPVALAVKTPLPLLLFGIAGIALCIRDVHRGTATFGTLLPVLAIIGVLGVAMPAKVDIGVRHVMPLYPFLALLAARAVVEVCTQLGDVRKARGLMAVTVASSLYIAIAAHPDHIAYFNPLAGDHPERVLVDSNLDWGQDLYRLADVVRRLHLDSVKVAYFGSADLAAVGVPNARRLGDHEVSTGWIVASQTMLAGVWVGPAFEWLYKYEPVGRIGPSLVLFRIPVARSGAR